MHLLGWRSRREEAMVDAKGRWFTTLSGGGEPMATLG
jgi:hypothetical protein